MASRCVPKNPIDSPIGGFLAYGMFWYRSTGGDNYERFEWDVHIEADGTLHIVEDPKWPARDEEVHTWIGTLRLAKQTRYVGFYAPVLRREHMWLYDESMLDSPSEHWSSARTKFIEQVVLPRGADWGWSKPNIDRLVTNRDGVVSYLLPLGIAHDAITLTTLILLIWSIRLNIVRVREAKRLRASQCPHCRYSIVGLPTNTCPECGREFELRD